jgi:hypothetical protein
LRHDAPDAGSRGRGHEISRALDAEPRILLADRRHLRRIADVRQIGQLVNDDLGLRRDQGTAQRCGIERIRDHAARSERLDRSDLFGRPRGPGDGVAGLAQEPEQRLPDHAGRAGDKDIHACKALRCHATAAWTCAVS